MPKTYDDILLELGFEKHGIGFFKRSNEYYSVSIGRVFYYVDDNFMGGYNIVELIEKLTIELRKMKLEKIYHRRCIKK